jgi:predicted NACHT family NTPase
VDSGKFGRGGKLKDPSDDLAVFHRASRRSPDFFSGLLNSWFQGQEKFPAKRTEFYKQGLDLLLGKWDETKGIERDDGYRDFRLPQKLRLLSQLAAVTFEQGQYFFEQRIIEQYIEDYLRNLPGAILEPEELQLERALLHNYSVFRPKALLRRLFSIRLSN